MSSLRRWVSAGRLKSREHIVASFDRFPETLLMLFRRENTGQLFLKIAVA